MDPEYRNRFYRGAREIIRCYGAIGPQELAKRIGVTPRQAYLVLLSWRAITRALRDEGLLPRDEPRVIEGEANGYYPDDPGEILTLEQAKKIVKPGRQLMTGPISRTHGL